MALIKRVKGISPVFGEKVYLAENATVVGEVTMGNNCSVWFSAVVFFLVSGLNPKAYLL